MRKQKIGIGIRMYFVHSKQKHCCFIGFLFIQTAVKLNSENQFAFHNWLNKSCLPDCSSEICRQIDFKPNVPGNPLLPSYVCNYPNYSQTNDQWCQESKQLLFEEENRVNLTYLTCTLVGKLLSFYHISLNLTESEVYLYLIYALKIHASVNILYYTWI